MTGLTRRIAPGALAAACLAFPAAALADHPVSDAYNKPLDDGCQRNVPGLLSYTSPEWVYVNSHTAKDTVKHLEGVVRDPHTAGEDLPEEHLSYDMDFNVAPDAPYLGLAGGNPNANGGKGSGNWDRSSPDEYGVMHLEWETGAMPSYAWPDEGDRVSVWGQWIWDCGHWGEGFDFSAPGSNDPTAPLTHNGDYLLPGETESELVGIPDSQNIRGEQTELHPLQAVAVTRAVPWQSPTHESQTDVFVSTDGTASHADESCARDVKPIPGQPAYGPDFTACTHQAANEYQSIGGRSYDFFVPAPPKPSPGAQLRFREVPRVAGSGASEQVTPTGNGLKVRISFDKAAAGKAEGFGASYFVGWEGDTSKTPDHLQVTLNSITVHHSLDPNPSRPQQSGVPPGEYNLYIDANGYWNFVGGRGPTGAVTGGGQQDWIPGLGAVQDGQTFGDINRTVDLFVPPGKRFRLFVDARECDLPHMDPCANTTELSDGNDSPGDHADEFKSVAAALGKHTLKPDSGNYEMTYTVKKVPGAGGGPSPPGSTGVPSSSGGGKLGGAGTLLHQPHLVCADVRAPRSLFARRALRASRRGLRLRGSARDRGCGGVARVTVA
ncbi:MAG: hypothetical protein QOD53_923, partial [Thermoleophilaceae bacterium]|nr:hypothetical protein [Thermoleophilaceae bacterium]